MAQPQDKAAETTELQRRAEELARLQRAALAETPASDRADELLGLVQELQKHHVELETQNEDLRRTQADLELARTRLFELYDQAPVGYCTLDGNGLILEVNQTAVQMLGRPRERLAGRPFTTLILREDRPVYHSLHARFQAGGAPFSCDLRLMPQHGPPLWASLAVKAAVSDPAGTTRGPGRRTWMALTDLSDRKRAEEDKACLEAQVRHAHRLEAIGRLAGGLAHDFNNLLGAMAGNLDLLRLELPGGPVRTRLDALDQLVARAGDQVARILTFAGKGSARIQTLDLNREVEAMAGLLRSSMPSRTTLRLDLGAGLPPMAGDPAQVQQVILNLVLNAAEALGDGGGTITLGTGTAQVTAADLHAHPSGQAMEPGPHLALTVADPGPGMAPEVRDRIFDPYFSTRFPGRGLGLAVVHGVLASHRGGIRVDSREGQGTSVTVLFPARTGPVPAPALDVEPAGPLPAFPADGQVLVVEDEAALRAVAAEGLRQLGLDPLEAADGLEALRQFEAHRTRVRLVLMDLSMPNMDGERAYRELRRAGALVPIVIASGFGAEEALRPFRGRGVAGFLAKPYRLRDMAALIQATLDRSGVREPVPWLRELETGHPALDANHQHLLQAYNGVTQAVARGRTGEPEQALTRLVDAASAHFALEEGLMQATGCPLVREHQAAHAQLIAQVRDLARRIRLGEVRFTAPVLDFLQDWVVCHIQTEGRALARHLKRAGH